MTATGGNRDLHLQGTHVMVGHTHTSYGSAETQTSEITLGTAEIARDEVGTRRVLAEKRSEGVSREDAHLPYAILSLW